MKGKKGVLAIITAVILLVTMGMLIYSGGAVIEGTVEIGQKEDKMINTYWESARYQDHAMNSAAFALFETAYEDGAGSTDCFDDYGQFDSGMLGKFLDHLETFELSENQELVRRGNVQLTVSRVSQDVYEIEMPGLGATIMDSEYNFNYTFGLPHAVRMTCNEYIVYRDAKASP